MEEFALFAGVLTGIVTACTQVIKKSITRFPTNLAPLLSVVVGIGLSSVAWSFTDLETAWRLGAGLVAGLSAAGLYDVGKFTLKTFTKPKL